MSSLNEVRLIGRVGKDPEVRFAQSGTAFANFSLATSEKWTDKNTGEKKELTEWSRCSAFGKLAEIIGEYVKKGSLIYVGGRLRTEEWEDKDGIKRQTTSGSNRRRVARSSRAGPRSRRPAVSVRRRHRMILRMRIFPSSEIITNERLQLRARKS